MKIDRFEDLNIWQEARFLCQVVYKVASINEFRRDFSLKRQITSSAGSVMDNIAEGFERGGNKEFIHFLYIAKASCSETRSQSYRAYDCNYITEKQFNELLELTEQLSRRITAMISYLSKSKIKGRKYHQTTP